MSISPDTPLATFRDITQADALSVLSLREEAVSEPLMGLRRDCERQATLEAVTEWLADEHRVTIGAFTIDSPATLLGTCTVESRGDRTDYGLSGLYVRRAAQGGGLGSRLVEECMKHKFAATAETFDLEVFSPTNGPDSAARRIYKKHDFKNSWDPEESPDYPPGLSKYTMNRQVGEHKD